MLKVVAGTPDAGDLERVRFTEWQWTQSNNREIKIYTRIQSRINQLTTVNQILQTHKNTQIDTGHLYETLLARTRILMMELPNLMLAVTLAKNNIVSPNILDHAERTHKYPHRGSYTHNIIHFIIKFPKIKVSFKKVTIFPVTCKGVMLRITDNMVAKCGEEVHTIENCIPTPGTTFCQLSTESSCARKLHAGVLAHCESKPNDLHPLTRVDEEIIIINDRPARVTVDNGIRGTHLITMNDRVLINDTTFINHDKAQIRALGVAIMGIYNGYPHY